MPPVPEPPQDRRRDRPRDQRRGERPLRVRQRDVESLATSGRSGAPRLEMIETTSVMPTSTATNGRPICCLSWAGPGMVGRQLYRKTMYLQRAWRGLRSRVEAVWARAARRSAWAAQVETGPIVPVEAADVPLDEERLEADHHRHRRDEVLEALGGEVVADRGERLFDPLHPPVAAPGAVFRRRCLGGQGDQLSARGARSRGTSPAPPAPGSRGAPRRRPPRWARRAPGSGLSSAHQAEAGVGEQVVEPGKVGVDGAP